MKSITIHGIDEQMERLIKKRAKADGASLNKTIKELLRSALGVGPLAQEEKRKSLMQFFGVWSKKDAEEFEKNIADSERIDKSDWE